MTKLSPPDAAWYDELTLGEAEEVSVLDVIIDGLRASMKAAMARRDLFLKRAHGRIQTRKFRSNGGRKR